MGTGYDAELATMTYLALTREELVARCVSKDTTIRILNADLAEARLRVITLERAVAVGRNRI